MSKFVIAIGGTGMRCLEAFVHLCAIGLFDNEEINILTLDTDQNNGNKGRTEDLIDLYQRVKSDTPENIDGGKPNADTFFSAKLNLYKFFTNYTTQSRLTYRSLARLNAGTADVQQDNKDLADLFLDPETVQLFNLDNGYRAQTHLGSMLMYHGIIEAAKNVVKDSDKAEAQEKQLVEFITKLAQAAENSQVFVFGSVFGGTGASSIPIIPVAMRDAIKISSGGTQTLDLKKVKFGATLLTEYFTFNAPDDTQKKNEHVVADACNFAINSQAAMQFYKKDATVNTCYKRLYHVGWPTTSRKLMDDSNKTITGGAEQKNACHVVELMCACAAYDFFAADPEKELNNDKTQYLYREVGCDDKSFQFTGSDFLGSRGDMFMNKLGAFLSFAHIVLSLNGAALRGEQGVKGFLVRLDKQGIKEYNAITDDQGKEIDKYMKAFAYDFDTKNNKVKRGWLYQVYQSTAGKFFFKSNAFTENPRELRSIDPGNFFDDDKHNWDKGKWLSGRYDNFISCLVDKESYPKEKQHVATTKEKFLARIYNGITIAQKFNN